MSEVARALRRLAEGSPIRLARTGTFVPEVVAGLTIGAWWSVIAPFRAAVVGLPSLPAEEALSALVLVALACAVPARAKARAATAVALSGSLAVGAVAGWLATASPASSTAFANGAAVLGLPLAAILSAFAAQSGACPQSAALATARCAAGAACGTYVVACVGAAGATWSATTGIVAILAAISCGLALLPVAPGRTDSTDAHIAAPMRCGAMVGALLTWALAAPSGIGPSPAAFPLFDQPSLAWMAAALGSAVAAKWAWASAPASRALGCAGCAVAVASAGSGSAAAAGIALSLAAAIASLGWATATRSRLSLGLVLGGAIFVLASLCGTTPSASIGLLAGFAGLGVARRGAAGWFAAAIGVAVACSVSVGERPPSADPLSDRLLAAHGAARVTWRPSTQEVVLAVDEMESDRSGPLHRHAELAAAVVALLAENGPVAVLDDGVGAFAQVARDCGIEPLWRSIPAADVAKVAHSTLVDGPARERAMATGAQDHGAASVGTRAFALHVQPGGCSAVVDASLIGKASRMRATAEEHQAMARAAGDGAVVTCWSLQASPPDLVRCAVNATALAHGWCGVFVVDASAVVVGMARAPDWKRAEARCRALPRAARWRLHAASIGSAQDLRDALVAVVAASDAWCRDDSMLLAPAAALPVTDQVGQSLRLLESWCAPASVLPLARLHARGDDLDAWNRADTILSAAVAATPECVLLRRELIGLRVRRADHLILSAQEDAPTRVAEAAAMAARFVAFGCPSAPLQAALALPSRSGERLRDRRSAAAAAFALDPGFYDRASPLLRDVLEGSDRATPAADFARFPHGQRLAELSAQDGPLAILLRVRHASRAAQALVEQWGRGELSAAAVTALREIADPFVLQAAAEALAIRGAARELVRIWRADLPATAAIIGLLDGPPEQRQAVLIAVAGRKDADSLCALARGLVDADEVVRTAAAAALFRSIGDGIAYDPSWPPDRLREAAVNLEKLSQRTSR